MFLQIWKSRGQSKKKKKLQGSSSQIDGTSPLLSITSPWRETMAATARSDDSGASGYAVMDRAEVMAATLGVVATCWCDDDWSSRLRRGRWRTRGWPRQRRWSSTTRVEGPRDRDPARTKRRKSRCLDSGWETRGAIPARVKLDLLDVQRGVTNSGCSAWFLPESRLCLSRILIFLKGFFRLFNGNH